MLSVTNNLNKRHHIIVNMDIDTIKQTYKYLLIDSNSNEHHIFKTDRQISDFMIDTYGIKLSHMYIKRNIMEKNEDILIEGIIITNIW
tara:strand:+ start:212 stop:475 length:264 start_codon:yes stop_codon:yes gene_type:complete